MVWILGQLNLGFHFRIEILFTWQSIFTLLWDLWFIRTTLILFFIFFFKYQRRALLLSLANFLLLLFFFIFGCFCGSCFHKCLFLEQGICQVKRCCKAKVLVLFPHLLTCNYQNFWEVFNFFRVIANCVFLRQFVDHFWKSKLILLVYNFIIDFIKSGFCKIFE